MLGKVAVLKIVVKHLRKNSKAVYILVYLLPKNSWRDQILTLSHPATLLKLGKKPAISLKKGLSSQLRASNLKAHSQVWDSFFFFFILWKWWKNAFYFTLRAIFVLKIFKFPSSLFCHRKTAWLER